MIRESKQLQIGKAGEYLVCADLILKGLIAFPSEQGLPYDVVADNGKKLLRIQVKTTEKPSVVPQNSCDSMAYRFGIKRAGRNGKTRYNEDEVDLFALVCLDSKNIGYLLNKDMPTTINLRVDKLRGTYYDEKGIVDYQNSIELYKSIKNKSEIARMLNIHIATVNRYLNPKWKPFVTNARYFSDFNRERGWFDGL